MKRVASTVTFVMKTFYVIDHVPNVTLKLNPPKRNFTLMCQNCENYKKLFLILKEHKEQCYQLKQQINFARPHRLHHKFNQIKSVDTQLKTGIA